MHNSETCAKHATCLLGDFNIKHDSENQDIICTCKHATNTQENLHKEGEMCWQKVKAKKKNRIQCFIDKDKVIK